MRFEKRFAIAAAIAAALTLLSAVGARADAGADLLKTGKFAFTPPRLAKPLTAAWRLERLVSPKGRDEKYERVADPAKAGVEAKAEVKTLSPDAVEIVLVFKNAGGERLLLSSVVEAPIVIEDATWWNGYNNMIQVKFDPNDTSLSTWFPANAAIGPRSGMSLGVNPMSIYSRIDSTKIDGAGGEALSIRLPFILDPGASFDVSYVLTAFPSRYGYRDVIQNYYNLFPRAYEPASDIHPGVISGESSYLFWQSERSGYQFVGDLIRRMFGGQGSWEWCYAPFVRGGDWAISDEWSVGFKGYTKEKLEEKRESVRRRLAPAGFLDVAPMYYLNLCYTEKTLWEEHFPKIHHTKVIRKGWGQELIYAVYPWGNDYAKLFLEGLENIPKRFPKARGVGWDSAFGHQVLTTEVDGVENTERRSFRDGETIAIEGAGHAMLLEFNHQQRSEGYRMANAVNLKLVSPFMTSARTDAALYEGYPMRKPDRLLRLECLRGRLGTRKGVAWHKHAEPQYLNWIDWDGLSEREIEQAYRQVMDDIWMLCYFWGGTCAPRMPALGVERIFKAMPELVDLTKQGWMASPAVDSPDDVLIARYGAGRGARLAVINPGYREVEAGLFFPRDYWDDRLVLVAREDGKPLNSDLTADGCKVTLRLPAREIVILRVAGDAMPPADFEGKAMVLSQLSRRPGRSAAYRFSVKTFDNFTLAARLFTCEHAGRSRLQVGDKSSEFAPGDAIAFETDSTTWPQDVQAATQRSVDFRVTHYPAIQCEVEDLDVVDLGLVEKDGKSGARIALDAGAPHAVRNEAERVREWFRFYTAATMDGYLEPPIAADGPGVAIALRLAGDGAGLEDWMRARVALSDDGRIEIVGRDGAALKAAAKAFLLVMDKAYPFVGALPEKDPHLNRAGLGGKVLKIDKPRRVVHPTLLEALRDTGVIQ